MSLEAVFWLAAAVVLYSYGGQVASKGSAR